MGYDVLDILLRYYPTIPGDSPGPCFFHMTIGMVVSAVVSGCHPGHGGQIKLGPTKITQRFKYLLDGVQLFLFFFVGARFNMWSKISLRYNRVNASPQQ